MEINNKIEGLDDFLKSLNIRPKQIKYYVEALTHKTYANEHNGIENYNMLEFVGDAIIQMKSSIFIFKHFKNINEGEASLIRAKNVCSNGLAKLTKEIGLSQYLLISKGSQYLKENVKINADLFEAFCAAIYLDLGDEKLEEFLEVYFYPFISKTNLNSIKDPKSSFQEYIQTYSNEIIEYKITQLENEFKAELIHDKILYGEGFGKTKKLAEEAAAFKALDSLRIKTTKDTKEFKKQKQEKE